MKRREFLQISSLSLAALLVEGCEPTLPFEVVFKNDMSPGHLVFESQSFPTTKSMSCEYLIVGGGIAGLTAAYQLRDRNFKLFEVSDMLGGTSAGSEYRNIPLCHGAHYDLEYPEEYGSKAKKILEELGVVKHDNFSRTTRFIDKQYLIPKSRESRTFAHEKFRKDVLPDGPQKAAFVKLMKGFSGYMPMPTTQIVQVYRELNNIIFYDWLNEKLELSAEFIEGLDYHMKDDYGAGTRQVSALAGVHYYACRPYYTRPVELFSPPEGNFYFIKKLYDLLANENVLTSHVVKHIMEKEVGFEVEVIDVKNKEIAKVDCKKVIYAGNKHALKYIYPNDYSVFEKNEYAPWVVVNFVMKETWDGQAFWQNEIISDDASLMGFVDSKAQHASDSKQRVLTVYFCYKPEEREAMSLMEQKKLSFIDRTIQQLELYFDRSLKNKIEKVFIKQMGHAMPIPKPGYLFNDANRNRSNPNLVYAGVDNGRLPLLYEAMDSGIMAVEELGKSEQ